MARLGLISYLNTAPYRFGLKRLGEPPWIEALPSQRVRDDPAQLRAAAEGLLKGADCLILTGGVSMGHRDFIPGMLADLGAERVFH